MSISSLKQIFKAPKPAQKAKKAKLTTYQVHGITIRVDNEESKQKLTEIIEKLQEIETGRGVLKVLEESKTPLLMESLGNTIGYFSSPDLKIALNYEVPTKKLCSTLVHESHHLMQYLNGGKDYDRFSLDLKSQIMNDRAKEADAQTWAIRASYELKTAGDAGPFNSFKSKSPEIFDEFQAGLAKSGGVLNKDVMTAAFMAWYDQTALRAQYEKSYMTDSAAMDVQRVVMSPVLKSGSPVYYDKRPLKSLTSEQLLTAYASNYFSGDKKALESDKCLSVSRATKGMMSYAFNRTGRCYVDKSLTNLPVTDMPTARQHAQEKEIAQENNCIYAAALAVVAQKTNLKEDTLKALLACGEKQRADILKKQRNPVLTNGVTCLLNLQKVNKHIVSPNNLMAAALVARQQQSR